MCPSGSNIGLQLKQNCKNAKEQINLRNHSTQDVIMLENSQLIICNFNNWSKCNVSFLATTCTIKNLDQLFSEIN